MTDSVTKGYQRTALQNLQRAFGGIVASVQPRYLDD